jgi:hypothetical protein
MNKVELSRTAKAPFERRYGNYINGKWAEPRSGRYFENFSPINVNGFRDYEPRVTLFTSPQKHLTTKHQRPNNFLLSRERVDWMKRLPLKISYTNPPEFATIFMSIGT